MNNEIYQTEFLHKLLDAHAAAGDHSTQELERFLGQSIIVQALDKNNDPISAYCYATPYPAFGKPGYRLQHGLLMQPHPNRVHGTIEGVDPVDATLKLRPRIFSPYRLDKGYFLVNVFSQDNEPLVKLNFVEQ